MGDHIYATGSTAYLVERDSWRERAEKLGLELAAARAEADRLRELTREVLDRDKGTIDPSLVREIEDILDATPATGQGAEPKGE